MELPVGGHENCPLTVMGSARHVVVALAASRGWGPSSGALGGAEAPFTPEEGHVKSAGEIMEILEAFDLTGSLRDAAELAGCSHHTVARYVAAREAGGLSARPAARPLLTDEYAAKIEEWVEASRGKVRADVAHAKLVAMGYGGSERTTRRAVAKARQGWKNGRVRVHRPWVTEPGMWLQYDFGDGPVIEGVKTTLFCAWLAWSRFRVVIPILDKTTASVFAALDVTLRRVGGVPTYVLTDNEKTVTVEHVAGMAVRNPQTVLFARHYLLTELAGALLQVSVGVSRQGVASAWC